MTGGDHHRWLTEAASDLRLATPTLWQAMCAEWALNCLAPTEASGIAQLVEDALNGIAMTPAGVQVPMTAPPPLPPPSTTPPAKPSAQPPLFP